MDIDLYLIKLAKQKDGFSEVGIAGDKRGL